MNMTEAVIFIVCATIGGTMFCAIILCICTVGSVAHAAKEKKEDKQAENIAAKQSNLVQAAKQKQQDAEFELRHLKLKMKEDKNK